MNFKDQYSHPKWQEKRLEVFADMKNLHGSLHCNRCQRDDLQLQVHHKRYVKNRKIWDYPIQELEVLCDECHEIAHQEKDKLYSLIANLPTEAVPDLIELISEWPHVMADFWKYFKQRKSEINDAALHQDKKVKRGFGPSKPKRGFP